MNTNEREALGRAIARVIDARMVEMRERVDAVEASLAGVPAAIERCAPADMVEALRESVAQFDSRNDSIDRATADLSEHTQELRARLETVHSRIDETAASIETNTRAIAADALALALQQQGEQARDAIDRIKDHALQAWAHVANVRDGDPGPRGKPGDPGPPGTLAQVRTWTPGEIYRAGEYVWLPPGHPHGWAMACAETETYEIPGDDGAPWTPYLFHGMRGDAGEGMRYRGRYEAGSEYATGDVVIGEAGSAWVRTVAGVSDALPGDGWGLLAKRGERGSRGKRGEPGTRGVDGVGIADMSIEGDALIVLMTDGDVRTLPLPVLVIRGAP